MPKDQFYHKWQRSKEIDNIYDARAKLLTARKEAIIDTAHTFGKMRHIYMNKKFKSGIKVVDWLRQFGQHLPTNRGYEHMKDKLDAYWFHRMHQNKFSKELLKLNDVLDVYRSKFDGSFGKLTNIEAEELRNLASQAFNEGNQGYQLGDSKIDHDRNTPIINNHSQPIELFDLKIPYALDIVD